MKKLFAALLALCLMIPAFAAVADTLTMGTNAFFPPYEYYEGETIVGIDADIAALIAEKLGMDLDIQNMEFDAIIPAVTSGKVLIGMAGMTVTPERLQNVNFSDTYAIGIQAIIVPENSEIKTVDDLYAEGAAYLVGVQQGTTGDIYCTDDFGEDRVRRYKNGPDAVLALSNGSVDCVIIDNEPAKNFVAATEGVVILESKYAEEEYAICMSLENTELLDKINKALEELEAEGKLEEIVEKYIKPE